MSSSITDGDNRGRSGLMGLSRTPHFVRVASLILCCFLAQRTVADGPPERASNAPAPTTRCVILELYTRSGNPKVSTATDTIRKFVSGRRGVKLKVYDLDAQPQAEKRLDQITRAYRLNQVDLPLVYGLNHTVFGIADAVIWDGRLRSMLIVEIFARSGCPRCENAKRYLPSFRAKFPGLELNVRDVVTDLAANQRFAQLSREQSAGGISFPGFWLCRQLVVGFESDAITGGRLEAVLDRWTIACDPARPKQGSTGVSTTPAAGLDMRVRLPALLLSVLPADNQTPRTAKQQDAPAAPDEHADDLPPVNATETDPGEELPIAEPAAQSSPEQSVEVPILGKLRVDELGMPVFTLLIGLVDGFNPCAMWVLLFLLSVLVNLQDRWKILAVAGTFVVVSGAAYYAFMAAWLNVLLWVGCLRAIQISLGILAVVVGMIHVKDFFAFKKGISLSIPESAKPGIYARVRCIVMAESLFAAITGATILAVLVNMIELLCTAGLPALYSHILTLQGYPAWKNAAYLLLYISAYMADDVLMVTIVVATLSKRKLQERQGRWLKLISGLVILALGLVMLFRPHWLG